MTVETVAMRRGDEGNLGHSLPTVDAGTLVSILDTISLDVLFCCNPVADILRKTIPVNAVVKVRVAVYSAIPEWWSSLCDG
jgi:hypothetical protein